MTAGWSPVAAASIAGAEELQIAAGRSDQTFRRPVPVWVVGVGGRIYVRTWHRRDTGWFGQVVRTGRARIRVPDLEVDVAVEDVGDREAGLRSDIDAAYRAKYGHYGSATVDRMVGDDAAAATLRLTPTEEPGGASSNCP
jgi:hypothetical protein